VGMPKRSDWNYKEEPVRDLADGELLVKILYISLDPAMRGWMNEGKSYVPPIAIGEVMRALALGRVVSSKNPKFAVGDHVYGVLGVPGMTAYFGLLDIGKPQAGQTVVVSGAAGAVGMVVGQIARIKGCHVVGIAGGAEKCSYLTKDLGFDAAIDYKSENVRAALQKHCPKGVDVYFDNVGGDILDAVLTQITRGARIVICGAISQYNSTTGIKGPANYLSLLVNRASMTGMVVFDYANRYAEAAREMAGWMAAGKLKSREDIVEGLETFPDTLLKLFKGENTGKLILKVAGS
jgi:NADPH-dependent curcumin reductase